jgi:hypothetical protein
MKPVAFATARERGTPRTREPQYDECLDAPSIAMGPMTRWTWRQNPLKLGMMLARYKFVAKMLQGRFAVAEVGCGDAFGSTLVRHTVGNLDLFDFDPAWRDTVAEAGGDLQLHDIVESALPKFYDAIYMLDVIEHIAPEDEPQAMANICASLDKEAGVFVAGAPSLESQVYAAPISRAGHVNCRTGNVLKRDMEKYFRNVFLFGMNDEMLHVGFPPMCHYLFALCVGPKA